MLQLELTKEMESLPPIDLENIDQESLTQYFQNTWELYEMLFSSIQKEGALYKNPDPLRHPLIFYLGHTAVFYINKLVIAGLMKESERINPHFERIFEQGVDPAKSEELGSQAWPKVDAVKAYRLEAYSLVMDFIAQMDFDQKIDANHPYWSIMMGLEHDRIHFETSSVLIRQYPADWLVKPAAWNYAPTAYPVEANEWIRVPKSDVQLGKPSDFPTFGWDNEYGSLDVEVPSFQAQKNLVSNAEFLEFVAAKGYENEAYWTAEGWDWRTRFEVKHPKFWVKQGDQFAYRAMFDVLDMPLSWPVEINQYEAVAFCNWKGEGNHLLSEAEFRAIAQTAVHPTFDLPFSDHYNLNLKFGSPTPVGMLPAAASNLGFNDVWGNVLCWLRDDFRGLPGYQTHPYYKDFSGGYMDDAHTMLLGGSWASSGTSASKYYRLWFRRYFYQHAGFRIARNVQ